MVVEYSTGEIFCVLCFDDMDLVCCGFDDMVMSCYFGLLLYWFYRYFVVFDFGYGGIL